MQFRYSVSLSMAIQLIKQHLLKRLYLLDCNFILFKTLQKDFCKDFKSPVFLCFLIFKPLLSFDHITFPIHFHFSSQRATVMVKLCLSKGTIYTSLSCSKIILANNSTNTTRMIGFTILLPFFITSPDPI